MINKKGAIKNISCTSTLFGCNVHLTIIFILSIVAFQLSNVTEGKLNKWDQASALWGKRSSNALLYDFDYQPDYFLTSGYYMAKRPATNWQQMNSLWGKRSSKWDNANALWGKRGTWKSADGLWGKRASTWNNANGLWGR
uniref:C-type lectin domain-containing protein n=1 Tax=Strongyloides papillosus TaxID=174720 RepID=A0A0N5C8H1_STREA